MPGTKQLIRNGADGRYLAGWNYAIDGHLTHTLVDLEADLEAMVGRTVRCTIVDSEGGGLPLGQRYAEAERNYIRVLPRQHSYALADFEVTGVWETVSDDPHREAALAHWADPKRAATDPRQFVLLRPVGQGEPTRIYTGQFGDLRAGQIPVWHRQRWGCNELRIRNLIQGANLNVNTATPTSSGPWKSVVPVSMPPTSAGAMAASFVFRWPPWETQPVRRVRFTFINNRS